LYNNALNRLADLEMAEGDKKMFKEREKQYAQAREAMAAAPTRDDTENFKNAIVLYEGLLRSNPSDPRNEDIYYQLAKAYEQIGELEKATEVLYKLIKKYPNGPYRVESLFRLGELNFSLRRFSRAEVAYRQVIRLGSSNRYYERSVYKHGWTLFKLEKYDLALRSFVALLEQLPVDYRDDGSADYTRLNRIDRDLVQDIFRGMNLCFSYNGGAQAINAYFSVYRNKPFEYTVYQELAQYYAEKERLKDAADVYQAFIARNPGFKGAPNLQLAVVELYTRAKLPSRAIAARKVFLKQFGPRSAFWGSLAESDRTEVARQSRRMMAELADYYHSRAQKTKRKSYYNLALHWNQQFVTSFPTDAEAAERWFLLAELYYEKRNYENAAFAYEQAAYEFPAYSKRADAAYAALDAYSKAEKNAPRNNRQLIVQKALLSSERFLSSFPEHEQYARVGIATAETQFQAGQTDKAFNLAKNILQSGQTLPARSRKSALLIMGHVAFDQKAYEFAAQSYQSALNLPVKSNTDTATRKKLAAATYRLAEQAKQKGDKALAANVFLQAANLFNSGDEKARSLYDAATALIETGDQQRAIQLLEKFKAEFPEHELALGANEKLAVLYEKSAKPKLAASQYALLAQVYQNEDKQREAAWLAAVRYEQAGAKSEAISHYKKYVYDFPNPLEQSMEARLKLTELYAATKQRDKRKFWVRKLVSAHERGGKQQTERTRLLAANAAFELAEDEWKTYDNIELTVPLKASLGKKKAAMQDTLEAYKRAADFGIDSVTTASTHRVAQIYYALSKALLKSERPQGLSKPELEEYALLLEEQAFPFEEKAIEIFETNTLRVKQGLYDEWVKKSYIALAQLQPGRYRKQEVLEAYVDAVN
jgi:tetratricopeptide (TPR) repeat protein